MAVSTMGHGTATMYWPMDTTTLCSPTSTSTPTIYYTHSGSSPVISPSGNQFVVNWAVNQGDKGVFPFKNLDPKKQYSLADLEEAWYDGVACNMEARDKLDSNREYRLPDGARLVIDDAGNYRIENKDAKVTYRANRNRDFSPHLNASDMLAKFVDYVRALGVKQGEVLGLPIELFINWLIIEAAERDQDPLPQDIKPVKEHQAVKAAISPKCLSCGRFIPREHKKSRFNFCGFEHGVAYLKDKFPQERLQAIGQSPLRIADRQLVEAGAA